MASTTATSSGTRRLVIVESPAKARKIAGYLGAGYEVEASVGHIRDLPQPSELPAEMKKGPFGRFAVDVDNGFEPYYVVDADKKKKVTELKRLLKDADELFLATDGDREGEAIAWHLLQTLKPSVPVRRMVFNEITREAIQRALAATRDIDTDLVDAQESRRILDRLYGYEVSPVLWRKVRAGLSAGRVQSVATRLVVERERERMAFRAAQYWDLTAQVSAAEERGQAGAQSFRARATRLDGRRIATGRDFDDSGRLTGDAVVLDAAVAGAVATALEEAGADLGAVVTSVETKPYTRRPAAPFTTSTLQQEASRKLRSNARATMRTAQSLYENGYITYMRTDSVALSSEAVGAARRQAAELYGADHVPDAPRVYASKAKNAQEAHEAIRPAGDSFRTPAQVSRELRGDEFRLYELIWKRTVASQMADARGSTASVRLGAAVPATAATTEAGVAGQQVELSASGTVITFRGFLAAYEESRDEDRHGGGDDDERRLPELARGQAVDLADLVADDHTTSPPPRYTEASLVKALEQLGIGRPSTYAATISVIADRGYVSHRGSALVPSWLAFAVTRLLEEHFGQLVDYRFTASMEEELDRIAAGAQERRAWLARFYFGPDGPRGGGDDDGQGAEAGADGSGPSPAGAAGEALPEGLKPLVDDLGDIDARDINSVPIGEGITLRVGRYGPYLEATGEDGEPQRASVPDDVAPDELTVERARELLATQAEGDRVLGVNPATGRSVVARSGRFGPYVTEVLEEEPATAPAEGATKGRKKAPAKVKPPTASLFKSMQVETVDLEQALRLLSLPRVVGVDPADEQEITAQNGRYGPYLKKGTDSRSLETEEQLFDVTLEQALALYAQPKRGRGRTATPPLRELGDDPVSGKPVVVKDGRFGPYVTDGETNATLRKDDAPESITPERAAELLQEKRDRGPAKKPARKPAAKKPAAKKPAAKKPAAKK
ncbi:type I DNA topoisomerase [Pseudokineococcus sp. 1T1Z-3]|uniref:type I DNA topoisomerase n=1 Tax=Pseudokineococcus sp. 1T1Z-3 TaxID=3132745 RepID=UPI0030AF6936